MASPRDLFDRVTPFWERELLPALKRYIEIPALSPAFDAEWERHGYLEEARRLAVEWLGKHAEEDWTVHSLRLPGRTPLILLEVPGKRPGNVLIYGHLDKQPEMEGWREDLGPWKPVVEGERLYGRGGADDGYALFATVAALKALRALAVPHPRVVVLIEFSEESGSPDLPPYLEEMGEIIGTPDLVIGLDSGLGDYERLWITTSLRGMQGGTVTVRILKEACHSGIAGGIVPETMMVMRQLLERLEDAATGRVRLEALQVEIPDHRLREVRQVAQVLGREGLLKGFSFLERVSPLADDPVELILNNTWRPSLAIVGQEGLPPASRAGNVMRAYTTLKFSFRLPPPLRCETAKAAISEALTRDPPFGARVEVRFDQGGDGWEAPETAAWLKRASEEASRALWGNSAVYFGLGATIPFMKMLGEAFPNAQFLITGVLGPGSNAHGPNEFLHIGYAKRLTAAVAHIITNMP